MFGLQLPFTVKPHTTFSNPCNKIRGKYFIKEVFLRLCHCARLSLLLCRYDTAHENTTEGRMTYQQNCCGNNNKGEDNNPKTLNHKNQQVSSQKFITFI